MNTTTSTEHDLSATDNTLQLTEAFRNNDAMENRKNLQECAEIALRILAFGMVILALAFSFISCELETPQGEPARLLRVAK